MTSMQKSSKINVEHINEIRSKFLAILDDFRRDYVFSHKDPDVQEYHQNFQSDKSQLQSLNVKLFQLGQSINEAIHELNSYIASTSTKLDHEKKEEQKIVGNIA